jgi:hypothetical protein
MAQNLMKERRAIPFLMVQEEEKEDLFLFQKTEISKKNKNSETLNNTPFFPREIPMEENTSL